MSTNKFPDGMKNEALAIMRLLGMDSQTISAFEQENVVRMSVDGELQELSAHVKSLVEDCENTSKVLVYPAIVGDLDDVGLCVNLLCVGRYECDYPKMEELAKAGAAIAMVCNEMCPEYNEMGVITVAGAPHLRRIG